MPAIHQNPLLRVLVCWVIACAAVVLTIGLLLLGLDAASKAQSPHDFADMLFVARILTLTTYAAALPGLFAALVAAWFGHRLWSTYALAGIVTAIPAAFLAAYILSAPVEGMHFREPPDFLLRLSFVVPMLAAAIPLGAFAGGLTGWLAFRRS